MRKVSTRPTSASDFFHFEQSVNSKSEREGIFLNLFMRPILCFCCIFPKFGIKYRFLGLKNGLVEWETEKRYFPFKYSFGSSSFKNFFTRPASSTDFFLSNIFSHLLLQNYFSLLLFSTECSRKFFIACC
jgi:hypothetical protein